MSENLLIKKFSQLIFLSACGHRYIQFGTLSLPPQSLFYRHRETHDWITKPLKNVTFIGV